MCFHGHTVSLMHHLGSKASSMQLVILSLPHFLPRLPCRANATAIPRCCHSTHRPLPLQSGTSLTWLPPYLLLLRPEQREGGQQQQQQQQQEEQLVQEDKEQQRE